MAWTPPTEEEFKGWLLPNHLLLAFPDKLEAHEARHIVMEHLKAGMLLAVARSAQTGTSGKLEAFVRVERAAWESVGDYSIDMFWKSQMLVVERATPSGYAHYTERYFDIKFQPDSFSGSAPGFDPEERRMPIEEEPETSQRTRVGRRPYEYWEPLLIEMARQLYCGELQPKEQADIEHAMQDWLTANNHNWGETQVRVRAHNLWKTIGN